jgi:hypothetical protein
VIISLQRQNGKRVEQFLRAETDDDAVETIRKTVTAMLKKPQDFEIGSKRKKWKPTAPAKRPDDERAVPEMPGM